VTHGETLAKGEIHILEIGTGTVEENDRGSFPRAGIVSKLNHMLSKAVDLNEAARRHMCPLDQTRPDKGDDGAGAQNDSDDRDRGHKLRATLTPLTVPRIPAQAEPA